MIPARESKLGKSYSQMGEDLMIAYHIQTRGYKLNQIRYLDIGAYDAKVLSNTYYFYSQGSSGVLIEPNLDLILKLKKERPRDVVLNVGIGKTEALADFYVISSPTLGTFSRNAADFVCSEEGNKAYGMKISLVEKRKVRLVNINKIIEENFHGNAPDLLLVDAEELDLEIIDSLDFRRFKPFCICTEINHHYEKITEFLVSHDYVLIGYNQLNAIFMLPGSRVKNRLT